MRGTEFAQLRAFAEVAQCRSFARAAERLRISPSSLSQIIRLLEERLGVVLLNRTTRRVSLTSAGERLLSRFAPALGEMEAAVIEAHEGRTRPRGVVRLHALRPAYERHVAPALGRIRQALPDVVLDLAVDDSSMGLPAIGHDLAISREAFLDSGWTALDLGPALRHAVVASPDYLAREGTPACPADLHHHHCIQWRPIGAPAQAWRFEVGGEAVTIAVSGPLVVSHCDAAVTAALQGVGIAYVLESYALPHTGAGRLVSLLAPFLPSFGGWKICHPKTVRPSPAALAVADVLRSAEA